MQKNDFGAAWLLLCISLAAHAWDEGAHSFLDYYNATALTLYGHLQGFLPRIDMAFRAWLTIWIVIILAGLVLAPFAFRNAPWMAKLAKVAAFIVLAITIGFVLVQARGGTVGSVRFEGPVPGIYTTPLLLFASGYLLWRLRAAASTERAD
jgi:hypothetical protein